MVIVILIFYLQVESVSEILSQLKRRKRVDDGVLKRGVVRIVGGEIEEDFERYVFNLEFRFFKDNFNSLYALSVLRCVEDILQDKMIGNIVFMVGKLKGDIF